MNTSIFLRLNGSGQGGCPEPLALCGPHQQKYYGRGGVGCQGATWAGHSPGDRSCGGSPGGQAGQGLATRACPIAQAGSRAAGGHRDSPGPGHQASSRPPGWSLPCHNPSPASSSLWQAVTVTWAGGWGTSSNWLQLAKATPHPCERPALPLLGPQSCGGQGGGTPASVIDHDHLHQAEVMYTLIEPRAGNADNNRLRWRQEHWVKYNPLWHRQTISRMKVAMKKMSILPILVVWSFL